MLINEIDLNHLRGIVTVADELSFGRAAERLHISQPPLTRLVAEVERAVGAKLFDRTTRRVSLTPIGGVFVAEASAVLGRMDTALETVRGAVSQQNGLLRLAYIPLALQTVLPGLLAEFRAQDHEARVDLAEMPGPIQQDALLSGRIDFGLCDAPLQAAALASVCLHKEPLALLLPEAHPLAGCPSVSFRDLSGETLILHPRLEYPDYYDQVEAACRLEGPAIMERGDGQNCMALLLSGAGLLLSPAANPFFSAEGFRRILLTHPALYAEVWAVWLRANPSSRVQALVKIARAKHSDAGGP